MQKHSELMELRVKLCIPAGAVVCVCGDRIRKAEAQMELNWVRDVKDNKKGFHRYTGRRRQIL